MAPPAAACSTATIVAAGTRTLLVRLTRTSASHHRMDLVRDDGTRESFELESRSCLRHDLGHFAVETEAGLADGFFGRLARGVRYDALAHPEQMLDPRDELCQVERVVGPLQTVSKAGLEPAAFVATLRSYADSVGERLLAWCTAALVARVGERLRRLEGEWRATPCGEPLELRFPVPDAGGAVGR